MNPESWTRAQLLSVCSTYIDSSTDIRVLVTSELEKMPDFNQCSSVENLAETAHGAYASAVDAMIKVLGFCDTADAAMRAELGIEQGDNNE